jgi:glycosidase
VYFVVTDRFVNGDTGNDHRDQGGGSTRTFDIPLPPCNGVAGNIGYLGGDFKGIADHLDYIREMGFTSVWITPVVDNPDEAFHRRLANRVAAASSATAARAGYHGYWGVEFLQASTNTCPARGWTSPAWPMPCTPRT